MLFAEESGIFLQLAFMENAWAEIKKGCQDYRKRHEIQVDRSRPRLPCDVEAKEWNVFDATEYKALDYVQNSCEFSRFGYFQAANRKTGMWTTRVNFHFISGEDLINHIVRLWHTTGHNFEMIAEKLYMDLFLRPIWATRANLQITEKHAESCSRRVLIITKLDSGFTAKYKERGAQSHFDTITRDSRIGLKESVNVILSILNLRHGAQVLNFYQLGHEDGYWLLDIIAKELRLLAYSGREF